MTFILYLFSSVFALNVSSLFEGIVSLVGRSREKKTTHNLHKRGVYDPICWFHDLINPLSFASDAFARGFPGRTLHPSPCHEGADCAVPLVVPIYIAVLALSRIRV